jgi:hypothetical protein
MSRGQGNKKPSKKNSKNFKKPLDKWHTMCYNIRAVRGERTAPQTANKKFFMKG